MNQDIQCTVIVQLRKVGQNRGRGGVGGRGGGGRGCRDRCEHHKLK